MSCSHHGTSMVQGSVEYIYADIRADRVLDTQVVSLSLSPTTSPGTWVPAEWYGPAGKYRSARTLLNGSLAAGTYHVFAKITDTPEAPIIEVGTLKIV